MEPTFRGWYERKMFASKEILAETNLVRELLPNIKVIAIVGISKNQHKDSHYVGRYLKNAGYKVVPVNPSANDILGEQCYPDLKSIPFPVDAVDIFRKPSEVLQVVKEAVSIKPRVIWLQLGVGTHNDAAQIAKEAGCLFFQNRCMKVDHQFLIRKFPNQPSHTITHQEETV